VGGDLRGTKGQHNPNQHPLQQRSAGVPQDDDGDEENHNVHDHVPGLGREEEPRAVEVAARPGQLGVPLRLDRDAADHAQQHKDAVAGAEESNEGEAEPAVERHHTHAEELQQDGQLEEEVAERVRLRNRKRKLDQGNGFRPGQFLLSRDSPLICPHEGMAD
jgi:hypothetical protein